MQKTFLLLLILLSVRSWALTNSVPAEDLFFQNVIYFEAESHLENGESVKSYCNGTLVSDRFVVTAAHCVTPSWLEKINVIHLEVGRYAYVKRPNGTTTNVGYKRYINIDATVKFLMTADLESKLRKHPSDGIGPSEDLAVMEFDTPIALPQDFKYARIIDRSFFENLKFQVAPAHLEAVTINVPENVSSSAPKRIGTLDKVSWFFQGYFMSLSTSRFAPDDSGAPVFVKWGGEDFLLGVVKGKRQLFNYDVFTPVRDLGCEIANVYLAPNDHLLFCR